MTIPGGMYPTYQPAPQVNPWLAALSGALTGGLSGIELQQKLSAAKQDKLDRDEARKARQQDIALKNYDTTGILDTTATVIDPKALDTTERVVRPEDVKQQIGGDAIRSGVASMVPSVRGPDGQVSVAKGIAPAQVAPDLTTSFGPAPDAATPDDSQFNTQSRWKMLSPGVAQDYKMSREYKDLMAGVQKRNPALEANATAENKATEQAGTNETMRRMALALSGVSDPTKRRDITMQFASQLPPTLQSEAMTASLREPPAQSLVLGVGADGKPTFNAVNTRTGGAPTTTGVVTQPGSTKPLVKYIPPKKAGTGGAATTAKAKFMTDVIRQMRAAGTLGQITPDSMQAFVGQNPDLAAKNKAMGLAPSDYASGAALQFGTKPQTPAQAAQAKVDSMISAALSKHGGAAATPKGATKDTVKPPPAVNAKTYSTAQWQQILTNSQAKLVKDPTNVRLLQAVADAKKALGTP